jgi:DNA-binding MarR family transcriptional regulator
MATSDLNQNAKTVLYGLVKYPEFNDRELSEALNIKKASVSVIRNRLKTDEYFRPKTIPCVHKLGYKILNVGYTHFTPSVSRDIIRRVGKGMVEQFVDIFYAVYGLDQGMGFSFTENFHEAKEKMALIESFLAKHDMNDDVTFKSLLFPFKLTSVLSFFNFAPILKRHFEIELEDQESEGNGICLREMDDVKLTLNEKLVLYGITKYPELNNTKLGLLFDIPPKTISAIKRRLEKQGLIVKLNIPNLEKLGFQILSLFHGRFKPGNTADTKKEMVEKMLIGTPHILAIVEDVDCVVLSIYKNYSEFKSVNNRVSRFLSNMELFQEEPTVLQFSIPSTKLVRDLECASMIQRTCELQDLDI